MGRAIDADALKSEIIKTLGIKNENYLLSSEKTIWDVINKQPTIEPERNCVNFEEQIHAMFYHIWDCEIDHPIFQDTVGELMSAVIQAYNNSRQPERKTGRWIDDDTELGLCCSECQKSMDDYVESSDYIYLGEMPIFCPNCGSYNGGDKE